MLVVYTHAKRPKQTVWAPMSTTSRFFKDTKKKLTSLKPTTVPPSDAQRLKFYRLANPAVAFKKGSDGRLKINRGGLASFRASKRARRLPITNE